MYCAVFKSQEQDSVNGNLSCQKGLAGNPAVLLALSQKAGVDGETIKPHELVRKHDQSFCPPVLGYYVSSRELNHSNVGLQNT